MFSLARAPRDVQHKSTGYIEARVQTNPPTNPNPNPSDTTEARAALLLQTIFDARFDLHAASAHFTATEIADLALTPKFEQRFTALTSLFNTTLLLRAATSRTTSMTALESVLPEAKNPVEKRRTATALFRATAAPLIPPPRTPLQVAPLSRAVSVIPDTPSSQTPRDGSFRLPSPREGQGVGSACAKNSPAARSPAPARPVPSRATIAKPVENGPSTPPPPPGGGCSPPPSHPDSLTDPDARAPRSPAAQPSTAHRHTNTHPSRRRHLPPDPTHEPALTLTPDQVAHILIAAAQNPDTPAPDAGLSTLAVFAAEDALIDNAPLNPGDPQDPEDVQDAIARLANSSLQRAAGTTEARDPRPPTITENQATYTRLLHTPGTAAAPGAHDAPGPPTHELHLTLTRCQDPHALNCWLLASITVKQLSIPP
jgi:hypothetical protein